jgi:hypothetical protein
LGEEEEREEGGGEGRKRGIRAALVVVNDNERKNGNDETPWEIFLSFSDQASPRVTTSATSIISPEHSPHK